MAEDLYIGNTDIQWFNYCKDNSPFEAVNFWQPSRQHFKALEIGGTFFFRQKSPINKISGFGTLISSGQASINTAWRDMGISNGTPSLEELLKKVAQYRKGKKTDGNTLIGFKILANPVFLDEEEWIELPASWSRSIVTGKSYSSSSSEGARLALFAQRHSNGTRVVSEAQDYFGGFEESIQAGFRHEIARNIRIGQGQFRLAIIGAYNGSCAISGCNVEQVLEAAHLDGFAQSQNHNISNGILLRRDLHRLLDSNCLTIDKDFTVRFSDTFKSEYPNSDYLKYDGKTIRLPDDKRLWPKITG